MLQITFVVVWRGYTSWKSNFAFSFSKANNGGKIRLCCQKGRKFYPPLKIRLQALVKEARRPFDIIAIKDRHISRKSIIPSILSIFENTKMYKTNFFVVAIILCILSGVTRARFREEDRRLVTRESVVENSRKHREKVEKRLEETREKISDHEEGRKLLEGDEYALLQKRVGIFERKLEKMSRPMDDRYIDMLVEMEKMKEEHRHHQE